MDMKKILLIGALSFLCFKTHAKIQKTNTKMIKKPFYLGNTEAKKLKKELIKQRINAETFNVTFKCDKYKKSPKAKKQSLNCLAVSISPDAN